MCVNRYGNIKKREILMNGHHLEDWTEKYSEKFPPHIPDVIRGTDGTTLQKIWEVKQLIKIYL